MQPWIWIRYGVSDLDQKVLPLHRQGTPIHWHSPDWGLWYLRQESEFITWIWGFERQLNAYPSGFGSAVLAYKNDPFSFCVQELSSMMVEVDGEDRLEKVCDHAEWRINTLQQHYQQHCQARNKRRRLAEHDEEVSRAPQQWCGSGFLDPDFFSIPDTDCFPSRNQQPQQRGGGKQFLVLHYFVTQIAQNWKLFYFWTGTGKTLSQFTKNYSIFFKKLSLWSQTPDLRSREQNGSGSQIQIRHSGPQRGRRGQTIRLRMLPKNI
jgi:hypothetical protein